MPLLDSKTLSITRTLCALLVTVAFTYGARHTLLAFLLAIFFAYLVSPMVSRVERWHAISRGSRAILAIPFLNNAPEIVEFIFRALRLRPQARTFSEVVLQDVHSMAANYIRVQMLLAGMAIVVYTVALAASRVQYGVVLGITAGILEFIPMIGPIVGAVLILSVAFLTGFHHILLLVLFLGCWRLLQDYFNSPRLMHDQVQLNPFVVIFAVLAGGEIAGFLGVFLSIPIAATIRIIWRSWRSYYEKNRLPLEDDNLDPARRKAA